MSKLTTSSDIDLISLTGGPSGIAGLDNAVASRRRRLMDQPQWAVLIYQYCISLNAHAVTIRSRARQTRTILIWSDNWLALVVPRRCYIDFSVVNA